MKKYTPGPWKFSHESVDPNWSIVTDKTDGIIANVNGQTGPCCESFPAMRIMPSDANATLIAAAPELVEALHWLYVELKCMADHGDTNISFLLRECVPDPVAALKKAGVMG